MENKVFNLFSKKKIMILGLGREGLSTYRFIRKYLPSVKLVLSDKKRVNELDSVFLDIKSSDNNVSFVDGDTYLSNLQRFDLIIKTPGIPSKLREIKIAKGVGVKFLTQTEIFLMFFKDKTIGITGTKGKGTTASLISHILKENGYKVELLGNIGKPVLDYFDKAGSIDYFVIEMSSHQLSDIDQSPHVAIFLNIFPEHLDYYENFDDYFNAKVNITKFQDKTDRFFYNSDFEKIKKLSQKTKATTIDFTKIDVQNIKTNLKGDHNLLNIKAAICVTLDLGIKETDIISAVKSFKPLEGRLETVATVNDVDYVNDTLSTIPQAAMAAIESFEKKELTLILGGFDRGVDFNSLGAFISKKNNIKNILLVGQTGKKIKKSLVRHGFSGELFYLGYSPMKEIVGKAYEVAKPGSVVLMSPASTSFDMFKNYKERGDRFEEAIKNIDK